MFICLYMYVWERGVCAKLQSCNVGDATLRQSTGGEAEGKAALHKIYFIYVQYFGKWGCIDLNKKEKHDVRLLWQLLASSWHNTSAFPCSARVGLSWGALPWPQGEIIKILLTKLSSARDGKAIFSILGAWLKGINHWLRGVHCRRFRPLIQA